MATRAHIREKYGIVRLENPSIANKELTAEEAKQYEDIIRKNMEYANHCFARKPKEERLVELVRLYASELTDKQLEHSLNFFEKLDKKYDD